MEKTADNKAYFDEYAGTYRTIHTLGIKEISGVDSDYFSEYKIKELSERGVKFNNVLDFGCGDGNSAKYFKKYYPKASYYGIDVSEDSILQALNDNKGSECCFFTYDGKHLPFKNESFDAIFVSCVFHHICPEFWDETLKELFRVLKKRGKLIIFEHNPYNPVTKKIVRDCPFDEDAILISPCKMKQLLAGYKIKLRFTIFFPRKGILGKLVKLERYLSWMFLGGQYYVICERIYA